MDNIHLFIVSLCCFLPMIVSVILVITMCMAAGWADDHMSGDEL